MLDNAQQTERKKKKDKEERRFERRGERGRTLAGVLQLEVFVFELVTIDRLATSAVVVGEISTLAHEAEQENPHQT